MAKPRTVVCPNCGTAVPWSPESRWRPFCSERCKMIDLGGWASEAYKVTTAEEADPDERTPASSDETKKR